MAISTRMVKKYKAIMDRFNEYYYVKRLGVDDAIDKVLKTFLSLHKQLVGL